MLKFEDLISKLLKTNVRFEISTFEIVYKQNFYKQNKNVLGQMDKFGHLVKTFGKLISDLKSAP